MAKAQEVNPDQLVIPNHIEVVPEGVYPEIDPEKRISLIKLLPYVRETIDFGRDPSIIDYVRSEPKYLESGLYIPSDDERFREAPHLVRVGLRRTGPHHTLEGVGVTFQPGQYRVVTRSPSDMGKHAINRNRGLNWGSDDVIAEEAKAKREAGHHLITMITGQDRLTAQLTQELGVLEPVHKDLVATRRTRYYSAHIEAMRAVTDASIHDTIETAVLNLNLGEGEQRALAINGIHKVFKRRLYGLEGPETETKYHWIRAMRMVKAHNIAKAQKIAISRWETEKELRKFQPALDAEKARLESERIAALS